MEYVRIGKAINTHGLKGELKIESSSDFDDLRYEKGNTVYLYWNGEYLPFTVATYRVHKGYSLVSFEGYQDINLIEQYKGALVCIPKDERHELEEGEYYMDELIGLMAEDEAGRHIGEVIDVEETNGAQNNLVIRKDDGSEVLVPYVDEFIKDVNLEVKSITIHVIEGLL